MKTAQINIKLTEEEKILIENKAKQVNLSVSEFIRFLCLNANVKLKVEMELIATNDKKNIT
jgi:uncharacterized protein (DUF1778 family)